MTRVTLAEFLATYIPKNGELGTEAVFQRSLEQLKREVDFNFESFDILIGNDAVLWDIATQYYINDYVLWNGVNYKALANNLGSEPLPDNSNTNWEVVTFNISGGANIIRQDFVATAGQTDFVSTVTLGSVGIFVEGVLIDATDYSIVGTNTVVFNTGFTAGTVVTIFSDAPSLDTSITKTYVSTATAGQTIFTTTFEMTNEAVYVNGVLQYDTYTVLNNTITFTAGLSAGDLVQVYSNIPVATNLLQPIETDFDVLLGQTEFIVNFDANFVQVYKNGIKLRSTEFILNTGTSITIPSAVENDWIQVVNFKVTIV